MSKQNTKQNTNQKTDLTNQNNTLENQSSQAQISNSQAEIQNKNGKLKNGETNIIHYLGIFICGCLTVFGIYQISTNRAEDGLLNIIIGSSLLFSFLPFDYKTLPNWQKALLIAYSFFILLATVYMLYTAFVR